MSVLGNTCLHTAAPREEGQEGDFANRYSRICYRLHGRLLLAIETPHNGGDTESAIGQETGAHDGQAYQSYSYVSATYAARRWRRPRSGAKPKRIGLDVEIDSAGTGHWHIGEPPDRRARAVALRHGIDIGAYRARQVRPEDFRRFSHIVALDPAEPPRTFAR